MGQRRLIVLGSGTSTGVPMIGCHCAVCRSSDPRDARTRPSVLIQTARGNLLVDTTPELRIQLLRERIDLVHALLYTHAHADHLFGMDDVRVFAKSLGGTLPVYCEPVVEEAIRRVFAYAFDPRSAEFPAGGVPRLDLRTITAEQPFELLGERVFPIRLRHGRSDILGFRIGGLAYCTDVSAIPDASWPALDGLDVLILDSLRERPHPTHFSLSESLAVVERLKPRRTFFTHISHDLGHEATNARLPQGVELAWDGLKLEF